MGTSSGFSKSYPVFPGWTASGASAATAGGMLSVLGTTATIFPRGAPPAGEEKDIFNISALKYWKGKGVGLGFFLPRQAATVAALGLENALRRQGRPKKADVTQDKT
jgi:hypothetical protein